VDDPTPSRKTDFREAVRHWLTSGRPADGIIGILLAYVVVAAGAYLLGLAIVDPLGRPVEVDFVNYWAAGRLALDGHAATAYDWTTHKAMEDLAVGHHFDGYYSWLYPPMFLLMVTPLALVGYLPAWLIWVVLTGGLLYWSLYRILPYPPLFPLLLAAPTVVTCAVEGQNGLLSAGLIGATLAFLERRPALAGMFLGLLTYKPQFGLLFPLALLVGQRWTVLVSATITALLVAGLSALVFGIDTWVAFIHSTSTSVNDILRAGLAGWSKTQSVYAFMRQLTDNDGLAWIVHGCWALLWVVVLVRFWTRPTAYDTKAALLATAAVAATPYLYLYDTVILLVPVTFLVKNALERGWQPYDKPLLALSFVPPLVFLAFGSLATPLACLALLLVILRREGLAVPARSGPPILPV